MCPSYGHALHKTRAVVRTFPYWAWNPASDLRRAMELAAPDIVVPACDRSVEHLHAVYAEARAQGAAGAHVVALIERSLGAPAAFPIVTSRYNLLAVAAEEGIRIPRMQAVSTLNDLHLWCSSEPGPCVLKIDGSWGGSGVRVIHSPAQADLAWSELRHTSHFVRACKRLIVNHDPFPLGTFISRSRRSMIVQSFISGRPANCAAFADQGELHAVIGVEAIITEGETGPARQVRIVRNAEIEGAARILARRLGISGFFGLDFMIEERTGAAYLIEMNPRITPPCYVRLGEGRDLVGASWASIAAQTPPAYPADTQCPFLSYSPVPDDDDSSAGQVYRFDLREGEPELAQELLRPFPDRTLLFRFFQILSQHKVVRAGSAAKDPNRGAMPAGRVDAHPHRTPSKDREQSR